MPNLKPLVIVLAGPTASGKTSLAIELAETLNLSIHNIDSRQIYTGMDIGTAKPSKEQQARVQHHLIDICEPDQPLTLYEFQKQASLSLNKSFESNQIAFLVGGSGLYLKALISGLRPPAVPPQTPLRNQLAAIGQYECHKILEIWDQAAAKRINPADSNRTQRALEVLYATGKSITQQETLEPPQWRVLQLGLNPKNLKERIAKRTQHIYSNGLLEETESLINKFGHDLPLLQTIGYREALHILQGELGLKEGLAITMRRTNQFAKRQRTWFRKQHNPSWLNDEKPLTEALSLIKNRLG